MLVKRYHVDVVRCKDVVLISDIELISNDFGLIGTPVLYISETNDCCTTTELPGLLGDMQSQLSTTNDDEKVETSIVLPGIMLGDVSDVSKNGTLDDADSLKYTKGNESIESNQTKLPMDSIDNKGLLSEESKVLPPPINLSNAYLSMLSQLKSSSPKDAEAMLKALIEKRQPLLLAPTILGDNLDKVYDHSPELVVPNVLAKDHSHH